MSTTNESGYKTFTATAVAIAKYARVSITPGAATIQVSGADQLSIGTAQEACLASGLCTVKLNSAPGTFHFIAAAAIATGAVLHGVAAGKVDDAGATPNGCVALEAATADGDIIECAQVC